MNRIACLLIIRLSKYIRKLESCISHFFIKDSPEIIYHWNYITNGSSSKLVLVYKELKDISAYFVPSG